MVAWLTWPSAVHTGAQGYHTPKQITAFISLNRPIFIKMQLWVTQKGEEVTAYFIACFVRFWCFEHPECPNARHTPVSRSAWKAESREAKTWKLKT